MQINRSFHKVMLNRCHIQKFYSTIGGAHHSHYKIVYLFKFPPIGLHFQCNFHRKIIKKQCKQMLMELWSIRIRRFCFSTLPIRAQNPSSSEIFRLCVKNILSFTQWRCAHTTWIMWWMLWQARTHSCHISCIPRPYNYKKNAHTNRITKAEKRNGKEVMLLHCECRRVCIAPNDCHIVDAAHEIEILCA